jgi:hypothetical protein
LISSKGRKIALMRREREILAGGKTRVVKREKGEEGKGV